MSDQAIPSRVLGQGDESSHGPIPPESSPADFPTVRVRRDVMSDASTLSSGSSNEDQWGPLTFSLEVRGGRTGFRRRPILSDRFLIGSDAVCDLRLDGRIAAPLHCLLRRDGDQLEAERLCDAEMTVNGRSVESANLIAGDTLSVGGVRLIVHSIAVRFDVVRPADDLDAPHFDPAGFTDRVVPKRTVSQLVDLIEGEQDRIRDFEDRRHAGAAALLDAVRRSRRPSSAAIAEGALATSLDAVVERLDQLAVQIERQVLGDSVGSAPFQDASAAVVSARRELLEQLGRLSRLAATAPEISRRSFGRAS